VLRNSSRHGQVFRKAADAFGDFYAVLDPTRRFNAYNPSNWAKDGGKSTIRKLRNSTRITMRRNMGRQFRGNGNKEQIGAEVKYQRKNDL
jgi:hypothetical protein